MIVWCDFCVLCRFNACATYRSLLQGSSTECVCVCVCVCVPARTQSVIRWNSITGHLQWISRFFLPWRNSPAGPKPHYRGFMITLRHTTLGRNPLDAWSARRKDLYLTTHNTHKKQTSMPAAGFEPIIPASERSQTYALDRSATGIGSRRVFFGGGVQQSPVGHAVIHEVSRSHTMTHHSR